MMGMAAAFRPRFRRGGADAEPQSDLTEEHPFEAAGDDVGDEVVGDLTDAGGDDAGDDAGEWLAYEFHAWSLESRVMLQQLLTVDQVVHSWQGTTLMVHESLEATVDSLVDEVEETERAKEAIARPIGAEDPLTAFELAEWPEALRVELMERLVQARVPHILDTEGDADPDAEGDPDAADPDLLRAMTLRATPTRPTLTLRARAPPKRPTPTPSGRKSATCWSARRTRSGLSS